jgi:hypothetical protein
MKKKRQKWSLVITPFDVKQEATVNANVDLFIFNATACWQMTSCGN